MEQWLDPAPQQYASSHILHSAAVFGQLYSSYSLVTVFSRSCCMWILSLPKPQDCTQRLFFVNRKSWTECDNMSHIHARWGLPEVLPAMAGTQERKAVPQGWLGYVLCVSFLLPVMPISGNFLIPPPSLSLSVCVCARVCACVRVRVCVSEHLLKRKTCRSDWLNHCKCNFCQTIGIHIIPLSVWVICTVASDPVWCMYVI